MSFKVCGDSACETEEGETCSNCPSDCGDCPLENYEIALIAICPVLLIVLIAVVSVIGYLEYQRRKLPRDKSRIVPAANIESEQDATLKTFCWEVFGTAYIYSSDHFQKQKAKKTQTHQLTESEAEREVIVDYLIERKGRKGALLHVIETGSFEPNVLMIVNILLGKGATSFKTDPAGQAALHHATTKGFVDVVKELLIQKARPCDRDVAGKMPLHIAIDQKRDTIAALLLSYMDNKL